jgi:hypothetical protein
VHSEKEPVDETGEPARAIPDPDEVASRAEGRPPEERSSEDPTAQAEAILQESEDRVSGSADPPQSD